MNMRTKRMLRRGLTALAAALAMMTALAAPAFAYAGDSAEAAEQQSSGSQTAVQTEKIGTVTTNGGRLNLRDGASTSYNIIGQLPCGDTVTVIGEENGWYKVVVPEKEGYLVPHSLASPFSQCSALSFLFRFNSSTSTETLLVSVLLVNRHPICR